MMTHPGLKGKLLLEQKYPNETHIIENGGDHNSGNTVTEFAFVIANPPETKYFSISP